MILLVESEAIAAVGAESETKSLATAIASQVVGQAPPCKNYQNLILFQEYRSKYEGIFFACQTKEEFKEAGTKLLPVRQVLCELLALSKAALKDAASAVKAAVARKSATKIAAKAASRPATAKPALASGNVGCLKTAMVTAELLQSFAVLCSDLRVTPVSDVKEQMPLPLEPQVISGVDVGDQEDAVAKAVNVEFTAFIDAYNQPHNELRTKRGRAQQVLTETNAKGVEVSQFGQLLALPDKRTTSCSAFACNARTSSIYIESMNGTVCRWIKSGSRKIVGLDVTKLQEAAKAARVDGFSKEDCMTTCAFHAA